MKKFQEYLLQKEDVAPEAEYDPSKPFSSVGLDKSNLGATQRGLRTMLGRSGSKDAITRTAERKLMPILRGPFMRLKHMGLTSDDIGLVVQNILKILSQPGASATSNFSLSRFNTNLRNEFD